MCQSRRGARRRGGRGGGYPKRCSGRGFALGPVACDLRRGALLALLLLAQLVRGDQGGAEEESCGGVGYYEAGACVCPFGFSGSDCEKNDCGGILDPRFPRPNLEKHILGTYSYCSLGGSCLQEGKHFYCSCRRTFSGKHCEKFLGCRSAAECHGFYCNPVSQFCECPHGFDGRDCVQNSCAAVFPGEETDESWSGGGESASVVATAPSTLYCNNNGVCKRIDAAALVQYRCICRTGFKDEVCTDASFRCDPSQGPSYTDPWLPCKNGGLCTAEGTGCDCPNAGLAGRDCGINGCAIKFSREGSIISECFSHGTCVSAASEEVGSVSEEKAGAVAEGAVEEAARKRGEEAEGKAAHGGIPPLGALPLRSRPDSAPAFTPAPALEITALPSCQCQPGYVGANCSLLGCIVLSDGSAQGADSRYCLHGSACNASTRECACVGGWTGVFCETCPANKINAWGTDLCVYPSCIWAPLVRAAAGPEAEGERRGTMGYKSAVEVGVCGGENAGKCVFSEELQTGVCRCNPGYSLYAEGLCVPDTCLDPSKRGPGICNGAGECTDKGECRCYPGFSGQYCSDVSCASVILSWSYLGIPEILQCNRGGECLQDDDGSFYCSCLEGFSGPYCEEFVCSSNSMCLNGGACFQGECICPFGFSGKNCQLDECAYISVGSGGVYCNNGGRCVQDDADESGEGSGAPEGGGLVHYHCHCREGFSGAACELYSCRGNHHLCHGGVCNDQAFNESCDLCPSPYSGRDCLASPCLDFQAPTPGLCSGNGICRLPEATELPESGGEGLGSPLDPQSPPNPQNPLAETYFCSCLEGYVGPQCQYQDCRLRDGGCSGHGECVSTAGGGYECICDELYAGLFCDRCAEGMEPFYRLPDGASVPGRVDPSGLQMVCADFNCVRDNVVCSDHGECAYNTTTGGYDCRCDEGFESARDACIHQNCSGTLHGVTYYCFLHGACVQESGRWGCRCDDGFARDGISGMCFSTDCFASPSRVSAAGGITGTRKARGGEGDWATDSPVCGGHGICVSLDDSKGFSCRCLEGWTEKDGSCVKVDQTLVIILSVSLSLGALVIVALVILIIFVRRRKRTLLRPEPASLSAFPSIRMEDFDTSQMGNTQHSSRYNG